MGIASFIIGILSLLMSCIPIIGIFVCIPAVVAIILGIVDLATMKSRGKKKKGMAIAGIILSAFSIVVSILVLLISCFWGVELLDNYLSDNGIYADIYHQIEQGISDGLEDKDFVEDKDTYTSYKMGEEIKLEGKTLKVNHVKVYDGNQLTASEGKEYILVNVTLTNKSKYERYFSSYDFKLQNEDNEYDYEYPYYTGSRIPTLGSQYIKADDSITGDICFQKKKGSNDYYLIYDMYTDHEVRIRLELE